MELRPAERLILLLLGDVHQALKIQGDIDTGFLRKAILQGQFWALDWEMPGARYDASHEVVEDVVKILDLHAILEASWEALEPKHRADIQMPERLRFSGFNAAEEQPHYDIARFLIEEMGRFPQFKGRRLDAPAPTLARARSMLRALHQLRPDEELTTRVRLNAGELRELLAE
jgi:uncharacterized protein YfbU (UPF0304 family)